MGRSRRPRCRHDSPKLTIRPFPPIDLAPTHLEVRIAFVKGVTQSQPPQRASLVRSLRWQVLAGAYCSRLSPPTEKLQLIDVFPGSAVHPGHRQIFRTMERAERLSTAPADESRLPRRAIFPKCVSRDQGATFEAKPIDESTAPSRKSTDRIVARTVAGGREAPVAAGNGKRPHRTLPHAGIRDSDAARGD